MIYVDPEMKNDAKKRARKDLARHVLRTILRDDESGTYIYRCKRPESSVYWFDVIVVPGRLFFTGDIGELILLQAGNTRMIPWVRRSLDSTGYLLSKVSPDMREGIVEWDSDLALMDIEGLRTESSQVSELKDQVSELEDRFYPDMGVEQWAEAWMDVTGDFEGFTACRATWHVLFQIEALRWLCDALKAGEEVAA